MYQLLKDFVRASTNMKWAKKQLKPMVRKNAEQETRMDEARKAKAAKQKANKQKKSSGRPETPAVPSVTPVPYAAMKASLVVDEFGIGCTPCGTWLYFTSKGGDSGAAPDSTEEKRRWVDLAAMVFREDGVGTSDCGNWMWFPPLDNPQATPGSAEGRTYWMNMWFEEEGPAARGTGGTVGLSFSSEDEGAEHISDDKDAEMGGTEVSIIEWV